MLVVKTRLKEIPGKGIGLIADQEIRKGQSVWRFNPIIDIKIKKDSIPKEAKKFFNTYAVDVEEDYLWFNVDDTRFLNHSSSPNIKNLGIREDSVAVRDIAVGEEITIDYREIDVDGINFDPVEE